jgi:ribosomal-protein-alanine N-acetyltransferase
MNGWRIATINRNDLDPILAIEQLSFKLPWGRTSFEGELSCQNGCSYVVKPNEAGQKSQIVAYAFLRCVVDELHILKIAVTPALRGIGIATWILNHCFIKGARRGANSVFLEVRPSNIPALGLYEKLGFKEVGRRPNYYTNSNEDALMMMKILKKSRTAAGD